jgi:menaquinol-cytochrome c reductase iron-sulfur subunit
MNEKDESPAPPPDSAAPEGPLHRVEPPASTPAEFERRQFLTKVSVALTVLGGATISVPGVGFVIAPLFRATPREWRSVGKIDAFKVGETVNVEFIDGSPLPWAGVTAKSAAWLRRVSDTEFIAFSVNCTHLGCPVRWMAEARLFMCPCHGGVYYADGSVAAGPPPRPLTQYAVRVNDGEVQIRTAPIPLG